MEATIAIAAPLRAPCCLARLCLEAADRAALPYLDAGRRAGVAACPDWAEAAAVLPFGVHGVNPL